MLLVSHVGSRLRGQCSGQANLARSRGVEETDLPGFYVMPRGPRSDVSAMEPVLPNHTCRILLHSLRHLAHAQPDITILMGGPRAVTS